MNVFIYLSPYYTYLFDSSAKVNVMFRRNDGITIEHERIRPLRTGQRRPGVVAASNVPNAGYRERRSEGMGQERGRQATLLAGI